MKRKNAIDNLFVNSLFVVLISTIIFIGCGSNTNETETTEVVKVIEDSEVKDEETTEADADSIISVVDDIENSASEVADSIKTAEPEVIAENTDTQAHDNTQVQQNTQATTSTEPAKTNSNSGSSSKGNTSSSNKSGSTSNSGSGSSTPAHQHNWKAVYRTVHHNAVTHTEDQGHYEDRGTTKTVLKCSYCGAQFNSNAELSAHQRVSRETYRDNPDMWHGGFSTINVHETNNVWVSNIVTVTDSPAWDEQVLDHYECSCGATK